MSREETKQTSAVPADPSSAVTLEAPVRTGAVNQRDNKSMLGAKFSSSRIDNLRRDRYIQGG